VELRDAALAERNLIILPTRVIDYDGYGGPQELPAFTSWDLFCSAAPLSAVCTSTAVVSSEESSDTKHDEVAATPALLRHISDHLVLPPGTHVVDVHGVKSVFPLQVRAVNTRSSGATDGCICDTANVGLDKGSAVRAAVCLIEL
jgi:hypothetical protein